jgi:hypothetical protein
MKRLIVGLLVFWSCGLFAQGTAKTCDSTEHRAFDFWVGEWSVIDPAKKKAGDSKIEIIQNGCVVKESWSSATSKYTGTSYNFYNQEMARWEQLWLDNQGGSLNLKGKRSGDAMVLRSNGKTDDKGVTSYNQITWTANNDGTVRQLWQVFSDDKKPQIAFDGLYRPSESSE